MLFPALGWMDELSVLRPFNNISVISGQWKDDRERLCAMKRRFNRLGKNIASSEIRTRDPVIRLRSPNRSATRTVLLEEGDKFDYSSLNRCFNKLAPIAYDGCMRIHQA